MTTRVSDVRPSRRPSRGFDLREVVFTISEARRALPYVARLLRDALHAYQCIQGARQLLPFTVRSRDIDELIHQRDYAIDRLNEVIDECNAVGLAHIHIPTGRAAFHTEINQRPATLLWRIGQPLETAWSDLDRLGVSPSQQPVSASVHASVMEQKPAAMRSTAHAAR